MLRPHIPNRQRRSVKLHVEQLEDRLAPASIVSTFDTDTDGWTVIDDATGPTHVATGGNPGGFIQAVDQIGGGVWQWLAPAKFLGDRSASYGLNLSFDLMQSATSSQFEDDDLVLQGAGLRLVYDLAANPDATWTPYAVPLLAASGWRVDSRTGAAATESQLQAVLADLTALRIRGEYRTGTDTGSLDNVRLEAGNLPESTFDTGDDGWRIGEFFSNAGDTAPTYLDSGGNPGGFIRTTDIFGVVAFQAPAEFLGDQSGHYGGTLHLEQRLLAADGPHYPMVLLSDGTLFLQFRTPPPGTDWTVYDIPLVASAGWEVSNLSDTADADPPATEEQLQQVLGNLTLFNLRADWNSGADRVDLDNVRFEEPVAAPTADLEVTISASPDPVFVGEPLTYTITVTNHGPLDATGVVVTCVGSTGGPFDTATLPIGDLPNGASRSMQIVVRPAIGGTLTNTATVSTNQDDVNPANNSATTSTQVLGVRSADLSVVLTGPDQGNEGDVGTYTITVTNNGPLTATGIELEVGPFLDEHPFDTTLFVGPELQSITGLLTQGRHDELEESSFGSPGYWRIFRVVGTLPQLDVGESAVVTFEKMFLYSRTITDDNPFEVRVSAQEAEPDWSNNLAWMSIRLAPITLRLDADQYTVSEDAGKLTFTVARSGDPRAFNAGAVLRAVDGTAREGIDYSWSDQSYDFQEGELTRDFDVLIHDDGEVTGNKTFELTLMGDGVGLDEPHSAIVTIVEASVPPVIELAEVSYEFSEGESFAVITARRTDNVIVSSSVEFTTINGTAIAPFTKKGAVQADYHTTSGTIFFRPRSNVATIRVPIIDDSHIEGAETFRVVLSDPSPGAVLGANTSAEVIIHDNDPNVSFAASSSTTRETGLKEIAVRLSAPSPRKVTVNWAVAGGTATAGVDYRPEAGVVTFRPGETRQTITLRIVGDTVYEGDETLTLKLSAPTNAFLGQLVSHRLTIQDDDPVPPPADPGGTRETALPIDLQTLPRQYYEHKIRSGDWEMFKVHLDAGEYLALDVDPFGTAGVESSRMDIFAAEGEVPLATIGASREPETNRVTDNPAYLFRAPESGDYYILLRASSVANRNYRLHFHRIGVSEEVPAPELLDMPGPMYAWFDGVDTVGITGPTGYGFTLQADPGSDWHQFVERTAEGLFRQHLSINAGSHFTLRTPEGADLPLIASDNINIQTKPQRWGDKVGVIASDFISFPVSVAITPLNELLEDAFGSEVSIGTHAGNWRISLGGRTRFYLGRNENVPIRELLAGVPYLRHMGAIDALTAQMGGFTLGEVLPDFAPIDIVVDPADPMLYVRVDTKVGIVDKPGVALSKHGLLEYQPMDAPNPDLDAGITKIFGHLFTAGQVKFKAGPVPLEIDSVSTVINLDADRDGRILGNLADVGQLAGIVAGDISEFAEILSDIQLGANGKLNIREDFNIDGYTLTLRLPLGRSSLVYNGLRGAFWVRGETVNPFGGTPLHEIVSTSSLVEGMWGLDGDIFLGVKVNYPVGPAAHLILDFALTNEGISAQITGQLEWSVKIDTPLGSVSGKAIAQFTGGVDIGFDSAGRPRWNGSIKATGKLKYKSKPLFEGALEAAVRSVGFRFKFPRGVGSLDFDLLK